MAMKFTEQQQKILNARNHNILVSAAAGSGKTAVLVERIVRMISEGDHPMDIDRLLVVTFTRAAAAQMRERIGKAISARLLEHPGDRHLQRQETLLHHAQITTIDSFCSFLLRNHFSEIGLDPGFRLMDETQNELLKGDAIGQYLEECYREKTPEFVRCVEYFCPKRSDKELESLIRKLSAQADSQAFPEVWLAERKKDYAAKTREELEGSAWYRELLLQQVAALPEFAAMHRAMRRIAALPDGPFPYLKLLDEEADALFDRLEDMAQRLTGRLCEEQTAEGVREELEQVAAFSFGRMPAVRKMQENGINPARKEAVAGLRKKLKERMAEWSGRICENPERTIARMQEVQGPLCTLMDLVLGYRRFLAQKKKDRNCIDFTDLEHLALELLVRRREDGRIVLTQTAEGLRAYYDEILIDEYQDSNDVQELLLSALAGEKNPCFVSKREGRYARFMVGDVKQSIYRFRNARPEIFQQKFDTYRADDPQTERIDLDRNFRSRSEVLEAANAVCTKVMRREIGGVNYDKTVALKTGADYPEPWKETGPEDPYRTEFLLVDGKAAESGEEAAAQKDGEDSEEDAIAALSSARKEALAAAQRIHELMAQLQVTDEETGKLRPLRYRDIVILVRSASGRQDAFREIFEKEGIPLHLEYRGGYFAAQEVRCILQMLRIIDNPRQDIPLYGALRGFFGGFSEDEIGQLRCIYRGEKDKLLYDCLLAAAGRKEQEDAKEAEKPADGTPVVSAALRERCAAFLEQLDSYRSKMTMTPVHELVGELIRDTGYGCYVRALPAGEQRYANLHSLLVKAENFEQGEYAGLFRFLRSIDQMHTFEVDYGEAGTLDENADVVRLTTIHKSKGLEYPVCLVCGLGSAYSYRRDTRNVLLQDADMGLGVSYVAPELRSQVPTLRQQVVADKIERDALGEELRILYVAMTRAKEKLILMGYTRDAARTLQKVQTELAAVQLPSEKLPVSVIRSSGDFMTLILESMEALREEGAEPIRLQTVSVSDLQLSGLENQMEQGILLGRLQQMEETRIPEQLPDPELAARLQRRFRWVYPYASGKGLFTKTTVTELKRASMLGESELVAPGEGAAEQFPTGQFSAEPVLPKPRFAAEMEEEGAAVDAAGRLSGAERGTAIHRMCEKIDYRAWRTPSAVTAEQFRERVQALIAEGTMPASYADVLTPQVFLPFLRSGIAHRMAEAEEKGLLRREQPFVLGLPANRLNPDFPQEETILMQGIMDAFFVEGEGKDRRIVVVDYKTDYVKTQQELAERYRVQLEEYAEALEKMLQLPVSEKILYSFHLRREIRLS